MDAPGLEGQFFQVNTTQLSLPQIHVASTYTVAVRAVSICGHESEPFTFTESEPITLTESEPFTFGMLLQSLTHCTSCRGSQAWWCYSCNHE